VPVKTAETVLRRVEEIMACRIAGTSESPDLAAWLASVPAPLYRRLVRVGLVARRAEDVAPEVVTLDQLCAAFKARAAVKPGTAATYAQAVDSLIAFYGPGKPITEIEPGSADEWRVAIAAARQGEGKRKKARTTADNRLAPATIAKRVHIAKQVFGKAVSWGWLTKNPFAALRAGSQANPARAAYVGPETLEAVLSACPGAEWRSLFAVCRLAGLRCPSEVGGLTWGDVDWENGRLTVRSPKTEHHGGGHAVRLVPMVPRLREVLADAFDAADDGESLVVPLAARVGANLRTTAEKIIVRAGAEPWPRLFQNLRASCETDWVQKYPAHVCAKWLGHSPTIAAQHYLQVRDAHFRDAAGLAAEGPVQSGAESGAATGRNGSHGAESGARKTSFPPQTRGKRGFKVGSTGFELPQSFPGKTTIEEPGGAESGALPAWPGADPLLAMVVEAWPSLPADQRLAVVEIIAAVGGRPGAAAHRRQ
jgi:integrase